MPEEDRTGDELTQELEDAWNLYTRVGTGSYEEYTAPGIAWVGARTYAPKRKYGSLDFLCLLSYLPPPSPPQSAEMYQQHREDVGRVNTEASSL